jgi:hypothetical protein
MPRLEPVMMATLLSSPNGEAMSVLPVVRQNDARATAADKAADFAGRKGVRTPRHSGAERPRGGRNP